MKMPKITQESIKEVLNYFSETGVFTWKVKPHNEIKIGDEAGYLNGGYVKIGVQGKMYLAHRLAWLYVYGYFPEHGIDHIDRIKHHNWISNLREVPMQCNQRNTGNRKDNISGIKGVCWQKQRQKWSAGIKINGKDVFLGYHSTKMDAAKARLKAEQEHRWSNCDSSSPAYQYVINSKEEQGDALQKK